MLVKKVWNKIRFLFFYLTYGIISADNVIRGSVENALSVNSNIEQSQEKQSLYKDLLKGEVTSEVKEARHEMYFSERESRHYKYGGNGMANKNNIFKSDIKDVATEDGYSVFLMQQNDEIPCGLSSCGIIGVDDKKNITYVTENFKNELKNKTKEEKEYRLKFEWDFTPRFNIGKYVNNLSAMINDDTEQIIINLYITKYRKQFDKTWTLFESEMKKIYDGNIKSDILDFKRISFVTYKSVFEDYYVEYSFCDFRFKNIKEENGDYILSFYCNLEVKNDLIKQYYNEDTAKKCKNKERRKNSTITFDEATVEPDRERIANAKEGEALIKKHKKEKK